MTYRAVDKIVASLPDSAKIIPIVVTSISDAQFIASSSPFGNIMADLIRTRLVQDGCATSEIRLRDKVFFHKDNGEFLLSRNPRELLPPQSVAHILTGTYIANAEYVYVSLKLISIDARIIAAADYVLPAWDAEGLLNAPASSISSR